MKSGSRSRDCTAAALADTSVEVEAFASIIDDFDVAGKGQDEDYLPPQIDYEKWKERQDARFRLGNKEPTPSSIFFLRTVLESLSKGSLTEKECKNYLADICKELGVRCTVRGTVAGINLDVPTMCSVLSAIGWLEIDTNAMSSLYPHEQITKARTDYVRNLYQKLGKTPSSSFLENTATNSISNANVQSSAAKVSDCSSADDEQKTTESHDALETEVSSPTLSSASRPKPNLMLSIDTEVPLELHGMTSDNGEASNNLDNVLDLEIETLDGSVGSQIFKSLCSRWRDKLSTWLESMASNALNTPISTPSHASGHLVTPTSTSSTMNIKIHFPEIPERIEEGNEDDIDLMDMSLGDLGVPTSDSLTQIAVPDGDALSNADDATLATSSAKSTANGNTTHSNLKSVLSKKIGERFKFEPIMHAEDEALKDEKIKRDRISPLAKINTDIVTDSESQDFLAALAVETPSPSSMAHDTGCSRPGSAASVSDSGDFGSSNDLATMQLSSSSFDPPSLQSTTGDAKGTSLPSSSASTSKKFFQKSPRAGQVGSEGERLCRRSSNQRSWVLGNDKSIVHMLDPAEKLAAYAEACYVEGAELEHEEHVLREVAGLCDLELDVEPYRLGTRYLETSGATVAKTQKMIAGELSQRAYACSLRHGAVLTAAQLMEKAKRTHTGKQVKGKPSTPSFSNSHVPLSTPTHSGGKLNRRNSFSGSHQATGPKVLKPVPAMMISNDVAFDKKSGALGYSYINPDTGSIVMPDIDIHTVYTPWRFLTKEFFVLSADDVMTSEGPPLSRAMSRSFSMDGEDIHSNPLSRRGSVDMGLAMDTSSAGSSLVGSPVAAAGRKRARTNSRSLHNSSFYRGSTSKSTGGLSSGELALALTATQVLAPTVTEIIPITSANCENWSIEPIKKEDIGLDEKLINGKESNDDDDDNEDEDISDETVHRMHDENLKQMRDKWTLITQLRKELKQESGLMRGLMRTASDGSIDGGFRVLSPKARKGPKSGSRGGTGARKRGRPPKARPPSFRMDQQFRIANGTDADGGMILEGPESSSAESADPGDVVVMGEPVATAVDDHGIGMSMEAHGDDQEDEPGFPNSNGSTSTESINQIVEKENDIERSSDRSDRSDRGTRKRSRESSRNSSPRASASDCANAKAARTSPRLSDADSSGGGADTRVSRSSRASPRFDATKSSPKFGSLRSSRHSARDSGEDDYPLDDVSIASSGDGDEYESDGYTAGRLSATLRAGVHKLEPVLEGDEG